MANLSGIYDSCEPGTEEGFHPPPCEKRPGCHSNGPDALHDRKILLLYANSGERWVTVKSKRSRFRGYWVWPPKTGPKLWARVMSRFAMRRGLDVPPLPSDFVIRIHTKKDGTSPVKAQWVGGCCRVGPEQVAQLAEWMKPDEVFRSESISESSQYMFTLGSSRLDQTKVLGSDCSRRRRATIANCGDHIKKLRRSFARKTL